MLMECENLTKEADASVIESTTEEHEQGVGNGSQGQAQPTTKSCAEGGENLMVSLDKDINESQDADESENLGNGISVTNEDQDPLVSESATTNDDFMPTIEKEGESEDVPSASNEGKIPGRRGRKRKIYDNNDDPETIKEKKKKRAMELKLKNLKWTLNQETDVSGKRQKKAPQRFELVPVDKRKSFMDDMQGGGAQLGNISWIYQQIQTANIYTLRLLHRTIYRKQGMFSEKHIRRSVIKFSGFPFDGTHPEIKKRREQLEKANVAHLGSLCDLLALRRASKDVMIDRIISFLLHPSKKSVDDFIQENMADKLQQSKNILAKAVCSSPLQGFQPYDPLQSFFVCPSSSEDVKELCAQSINDAVEARALDALAGPWKKPAFYVEGNGVKLKYIRAIAANIEVASAGFIELLHRLLYMNVDEPNNMRRSILEFNGLKCDVGTNNYIYRMKILSVLPVDQIKLICRVLCLPTWHRSRQLLSEGIMDFLAAPRISVMKKRVPPHFSDEITFSFDSVKVNKAIIPELKPYESEEIEIVPDIHIPDDNTPSFESDHAFENEYLGVKLKNFSNIHYQVISTPAAKLNDVHMILYMTTSAHNNIRRNVLEFSGFPFEENTSDYKRRREYMEQMPLEDLKSVATVLCVSQYIVDESKTCLIDAILKFLTKPSALLNSSTIMPTISQAPAARKSPVVKKKATSTSKVPKKNDFPPDIVISEVRSMAKEKDTPTSILNNVISSTNTIIKEEIDIISTSEIEKMKAALSGDIEIKPVPSKKVDNKGETLTISPPIKDSSCLKASKEPSIQLCKVKEEIIETDEPLSKVKTTAPVVPVHVPYYESDDEDDKPLSKMIGHPNDDQLRMLVTKIVKESLLEDITMRAVIRKVFDTYPNFDLGYRKEFIKSTVRQILSQMDDQSNFVTTTVINI